MNRFVRSLKISSNWLEIRKAPNSNCANCSTRAKSLVVSVSVCLARMLLVNCCQWSKMRNPASLLWQLLPQPNYVTFYRSQNVVYCEFWQTNNISEHGRIKANVMLVLVQLWKSFSTGSIARSAKRRLFNLLRGRFFLGFSPCRGDTLHDNGIGPPKLKFLLIFYQNVEYKRPADALFIIFFTKFAEFVPRFRMR